VVEKLRDGEKGKGGKVAVQSLSSLRREKGEYREERRRFNESEKKETGRPFVPSGRREEERKGTAQKKRGQLLIVDS